MAACERNRFTFTRQELEQVVRENGKQRFSFDETGRRIRANQGHSVEVDLELEAQDPPEVLYHGTGSGSLAAVLSQGLLRMSRHHVHLSSDVETARAVGARHGRPVVLTVDAGAMARAGLLFYRSANGVWLTDHVPPAYLRQAE
jgi:putative RNA 2'-phosphotransferase